MAVHLRDAGLPGAARLDASSNADVLWARASGSRHIKTLRNRALSWRPLKAWLEVTHGIKWPGSAEMVLQYLSERTEVKPIGKTIPCAILGTIGFFEQVGQVELSKRLSEDGLRLESIKFWTAELHADTAPVRQAPGGSVVLRIASLQRSLGLWVEVLRLCDPPFGVGNAACR